MARVLLAAGADVNVKDSRERTTLHLAVRAKILPITRILLQAGATANTVDINGALT